MCVQIVKASIKVRGVNATRNKEQYGEGYKVIRLCHRPPAHLNVFLVGDCVPEAYTVLGAVRLDEGVDHLEEKGRYK